MKKAFTYLALNCLLMPLRMQSQEINWGTPFSPDDDNIVHSIVEVGDTLYQISKTACCDEYSSSRLSPQLMPEGPVPLYAEGQKTGLGHFHINNGKSLTIQISEVKDSSSITVTGEWLQLSGGEILHSAQLASVPIPEKRTRPQWSSAVSEDSALLALLALKPFDPKFKATVECWTFNDSLRQVHHESLELPFDRDDFELLGSAVNDSGIVFFAGKTGLRLNSPFRRKYILFSYAPSTRELREFSLTPENIYLRDVVLDLDPAGNMHAVATYGKDPFDEAQSLGLAYMAVAADGKTVLEGRLQPYQNNIKGEGFEDTEGSGHMNLLKLLFYENGPVAVLERQFRDQVCTTDPRTGIITCTDQYNFNEVKLVALGSFPWQEINIPKKQIVFATPDPYVSTFAAIRDQTIFLIYNDHHKNEFPAGQARPMTNPSRSVPRMVTIAPNGAVNMVELSSERQSTFAIEPINIQDTGGEVIITAESNRERRYGRLRLQAHKP